MFSPEPPKKPPLRRGTMPIVFLSVSIFLLVVGTSVLLMRSATELRKLATSSADSIIWTVSQAEVDYLTLLNVLERSPDAIDLAQLRSHADVFYSRVSILNSAPVYQEAVQRAGRQTEVQRVLGVMNGLLPVLDGPDDALRAAIGAQLLPAMQTLHPDLRQIATSVVSATAQIEQAFRLRLFGLLRSVALVAGFLVLALGLFAFVYWRLFKYARQKAAVARQTGRHLSTIVTTSKDAIVVTDAADRITEFNAAAQMMFGRARATVLGRRFAHLCQFDEAAAWAGTHRVRGIHANGHDLALEMTRGVDRQGRGMVKVYVLRDIGYRLRIEEDLRESRDKALSGEQAKARFLAVMSHEMRTPLNGILGVVGLLRDELRDQNMGHYLDVLENSGDILLGHINDVLDITQIEARALVLSPQPVQIARLCQSVVENLRPSATAKGLALQLDVHNPSGAAVMADSQRLRQILTNLLSNAVKYTETGQILVEVVVPAPDAAQMVEIQVSDTGIGIPQAQLSRIFDDFVRLDLPKGMQAQGTGLGLGITRRIVQAMGGTIGVESELGQGSMFWVRLPLPRAVQHDSAAAPAPVGPAGGRALRVLVVEDNPINQFVLGEMLRKDGHSVVLAENGAKGVEAAEKEAFDLVLMDLSMPVMGGIEATERLRAGTGPSAKTRIVAITAHVFASESTACRAAGFDQVMTKPLTRESLRQLVAGLPAAAPNTQAAPVVDRSVLTVLAELMGPEALAEGLAGLAREGAQLADALRANNTDHRQLAAMVHGFAGMAATYGARRLHGLLVQFETALETHSQPPPLDAFTTLLDETTQLLALLRPQATPASL